MSCVYGRTILCKGIAGFQKVRKARKLRCTEVIDNPMVDPGRLTAQGLPGRNLADAFYNTFVTGPDEIYSKDSATILRKY